MRDSGVQQQSDEAMFTFSWLALRLLGRGLYSNPWSALSELVANGLDAGAKNVYVYIDARDKSSATVEVIDDGTGMNREDISTYVKVGHDKRKDMHRPDDQDQLPKGRKGIGKLAALFLSQHFYLRTKHRDGATEWELDARDEVVTDDAYPVLHAAGQTPPTVNDTLWKFLDSGTRITMLDVDLTGYGPQSMNSLGSRLANQFLLPASEEPQILLAVQMLDASTEADYAPVEKTIAFGNFAELAHNFQDDSHRPTELLSQPAEVALPAKGLPGDVYRHVPEWINFPNDFPNDEAWDEIAEHVDLENRTYMGVPFVLTGWIGAHATIEMKEAVKNDDRFVRNKYYNPAQIRVYVRGKLATDRLLAQLGLSDTYANYIEGEISFDVMDDDKLPDIATSNRQDFDETDNRVTLLRALVRPVVRALVQRRAELAKTIGEEVKQEKARRDSASKRHFTEQLRGDFAQYPDISETTSDQLQMVIANKIQGDITPKEQFRVFISHAHADKAFASFIDEVLRAVGATEEEIFFTSRAGSTAVTLDDRSLAEIIKKNITDSNTLLFYLTSKNFLRSEFCLFEGGAGWATRSVSEYLKLNMDFESIPKFLTNGRAESTILNADEIELTPELHNYLLEGIFNPMIAHLNRGREIAGSEQIPSFTRQTPPSPVEMDRLGKSTEDFFDATLVEHWRVLVAKDRDAYLKAYRERK